MVPPDPAAVLVRGGTCGGSIYSSADALSRHRRRRLHRLASRPRPCAAEGHEVVGLDCFTDYYDVALKEENARGQELLRLDLARDPIDLAGFDGVFHLAGQPGVRSFGDVFETYLERNVLASQRLFEAAARDGVRVVFASSSSIYGDAEALPDPGDASAAQPVSPYGITKLTCEHLARATAKSFGLDVVVARYFNAYGPRQRPDMAFTRIAMCLAEGRPFDLFGDGLQSRSFTYVADVVRGTIAGDGRAAAAPTTSAAARRRRCATRSRSSRSSPAARSRSATTRPCRAISGARRPTRR